MMVKAAEATNMTTNTTLHGINRQQDSRNSKLAAVQTHQRVLTPASVAYSYLGGVGTTEGRGVTEAWWVEDGTGRREVVFLKASATGSTIMMGDCE